MSNFFFTCNSCSDFTVYNKESALTVFSTSGMIHPHTNTRIKHKNRYQWVYFFFIIFFFLTVYPIIFTTPLECSQKSSFNNCSRHIISCIPLVFPFVCRSKRQKIMLHKNTFNDSSSLLRTITTCRIIESFIFWVRDANQPVTDQDETTFSDTC